MMTVGIDKPIILFDGVCNLCQGSVQFVIKHDNQQQFLFASLQSRIANELLNSFGKHLPAADSIVLIENGKVYRKSTAALRICRKLNKGYSLFYGLIIIPQLIRDVVYDFLARRRYRWFGKMEECWIPTPELRARFLG